MQFSYNSKKIEFYDPSQARDDSGRWSGSGASSAQVADKSVATDNGRKTTTVYHGTSADVLKKIRENGLQPSKDGVYGKGVYATDHLEVALEYGAMKATDAPKVGGRSFIGLIEVISSGFEEVSKYTDPTRKTKGDKKGDSISILVNKSRVAPSAIKSMKLFDLKDVRSWIFEGGVKPKPVAEKKLEEGVYYVPIVIHESELTNLEEAKADLLSPKEQGATLLYDPSQQRDESGKWSGSGASTQGKFIERIKRDNPNADVTSEAVKNGVNTIIKGVRGAKIAGKYGATKTAEIKKWLGSSEGKEFLNTAGDTLRVIGAGAIGAIRGINNDRYKILVGGLVNPALVPYLAGASATRGMFDQVAKEYRGKGVGRTISNKIREKIGVKPMQAFVETIKLQTKQPPIDDVVSYLADVLRVSIEEAIEGKERFEVVSFYDPSQERDSSGKWTSGGGSAVASEPEQGMPIYDEDESIRLGNTTRSTSKM